MNNLKDYSKDPTIKRIRWDCHVTKTLLKRQSSRTPKYRSYLMSADGLQWCPIKLSSPRILGKRGLVWHERQQKKMKMFCNTFEQGALLGGFKLFPLRKWSNLIQFDNFSNNLKPPPRIPPLAFLGFEQMSQPHQPQVCEKNINVDESYCISFVKVFKDILLYCTPLGHARVWYVIRWPMEVEIYTYHDAICIWHALCWRIPPGD